MKATFETTNPEFEAVVRASFARQQALALLGARLARVAPGEVEIDLPFRDALVQQQGTLHAGVLGMILDSACGYAALTLMPPGSEVVSIEYKLNLLAPAHGARFTARGTVVRPGRTVTTCRGEATAHDGEARATLVATLLGSMMRAKG